MNHQALNKWMLEFKYGKKEAFGPIYDMTHKYVFHYALSILKNRELAKDVMQNTYLKIMQKISSYQDNSNPGAWITTIVRNLSLDELRVRKKEQSIDVSENEYLFGVQENERDIDTPTIDLAKKVLPDDEYQILAMCLFLNMKRKEVAKILNKPISTITWKYLKALNTLKEHLEKGGISNED